jgi:hypothetical protein
VSVKWRQPKPLGYGNAVESGTSVAAPLLAGFSFASVIVISDDASNFRFPGAAILGLTIAAAFFLGAIQCGYSARQYYWSAAEAFNWQPSAKEEQAELEKLSQDQAEAFGHWELWSTWAVNLFYFGIFALLAGLAMALPPKKDVVGVEMWLRWTAVIVAFAALVGEALGIVITLRPRKAKERDGKTANSPSPPADSGA